MGSALPRHSPGSLEGVEGPEHQDRRHHRASGFPKGIADTLERLNDRPTKYKLVVHAEENAIFKKREDVTGCTIYVWPLFSCDRCAKAIISNGIIRVVSPPPDLARWQASYDEAQALYREAGVQFDFITGANE